MTTLYLDRKDLVLDHETGAIVFRLSGSRLGSAPLTGLERVVVRGAESISFRLLGALWQSGVGLVVLRGRRAEPAAILIGRPHGDAAIRLRQYALQFDLPLRIELSRRLVDAKVRGQARLLRLGLDRRPDRRHALLTATVEIEDIRRHLRSAADLSLEALMGLEGAAARAYFAALAELFPPSAGFTGRNRRPPRDPVNACLSLGYTLLHFEAVRTAHAAGLDPLLGFFHQPALNRDSLACDLVEPLRPTLDRWVWDLFRERVVRPEHFTTADGACVIGKAARLGFYESYESFAHLPRRFLRYACRGLVRTLAERIPSLGSAL